VTVRGAAFCVSPGVLATCARTVQGAATIRIAAADGVAHDAEVITIDLTSGLALLKVTGNYKPLPLAEKARSGGAMVACYAKASVFGPELDVLKGELTVAAARTTLRLATHPRSAGAPLMDDKGYVLGILSATRDDPNAALPVINVETLRGLMNGKYTPATSPVNPDEAVVEITVTRK